jgi:membrane-bound ClpP family serine protease
MALSELAPEGVVQVRSETWTAVSAEPVRAGENVEVVSSDGLHLQVRRIVETGGNDGKQS